MEKEIIYQFYVKIKLLQADPYFRKLNRWKSPDKQKLIFCGTVNVVINVFSSAHSQPQQEPQNCWISADAFSWRFISHVLCFTHTELALLGFFYFLVQMRNWYVYENRSQNGRLIEPKRSLWFRTFRSLYLHLRCWVSQGIHFENVASDVALW